MKETPIKQDTGKIWGGRHQIQARYRKGRVFVMHSSAASIRMHLNFPLLPTSQQSRGSAI